MNNLTNLFLGWLQYISFTTKKNAKCKHFGKKIYEKVFRFHYHFISMKGILVSSVKQLLYPNTGDTCNCGN